MSQSDEEVLQEYEALVHAMQSGVKMMMNYEDGPQPDNVQESSTSPKHLRVGVNVAMCDHAGLVKLLIDKGIITESDYLVAIRNEMKEEVKRYEQRIKEKLGNSDLNLNLR